MESKLNILTAIHFPIIVAGVYIYIYVCFGRDFQQLLSRMLRGFSDWEISSRKKSECQAHHLREQYTLLSLPKGKPKFTHHLGLTCLTACNFSLRTIKFCPLKIEKYLLCLFVKTGPILLIPSAWQSGRSCWILWYPGYQLRFPIETGIERATSRGGASGVCK